jgi:hypothetical protein
MKFRLMWMIAGAVCLLCGYAVASEQASYFEIIGPGSIDWSSGAFISSGVGLPPKKKAANSHNDREKAFNSSKTQAIKNMVALVMATRIDADSSVRDIASKNDHVMAKVENLINASKVVKQEYLSDGTVEIQLRMNMYGGFAQLILPKEIEQIETIKTVSAGEKESSGSDSVSPPDEVTNNFTGLVVDAIGTQALPAMVPAIVNENGKQVYGSAFVSREFAVQQGLCRYMTITESALKSAIVGSNPILVKGLRAEGTDRSTIVISNTDASRLLSKSENLAFLKQCRVIIVTD